MKISNQQCVLASRALEQLPKERVPETMRWPLARILLALTPKATKFQSQSSALVRAHGEETKDAAGNRSGNYSVKPELFPAFDKASEELLNSVVTVKFLPLSVAERGALDLSVLEMSLLAVIFADYVALDEAEEESLEKR